MQDVPRKRLFGKSQGDTDQGDVVIGLQLLIGAIAGLAIGPLLGLKVLMGLFEIAPRRRAAPEDERS